MQGSIKRELYVYLRRTKNLGTTDSITNITKGFVTLVLLDGFLNTVGVQGQRTPYKSRK